MRCGDQGVHTRNVWCVALQTDLLSHGTHTQYLASKQTGQHGALSRDYDWNVTGSHCLAHTYVNRNFQTLGDCRLLDFSELTSLCC